MSEHLGSWHDTPTRAAIVDFVERVTTEGGPDYVPPSERIAVYDNDGTLWCEKPMPIELGFILMRLAEMAEQDESLRDEAAVAGRVREGLRVARRDDHQALPRRRQRPDDADGRDPPGVRRPERRGLLARRRRVPAGREASDARPRVPRVRLRADDRAPALSRGERVHELHRLGRRPRLHAARHRGRSTASRPSA